LIGPEHVPSVIEAQRADQDPIEAVSKRLKVVRPYRLAKIMRIEYRGSDQDEVVRMVSAIIDGYRQVLGESFQRSNSTTSIALITKAHDELNQELRELERKYLELRRNTPSPISGAEGRSFLVSRLARWDQAANDAMIRSVQLRRQLDLGRKLVAEGTELWALAHAISQLGGDTHNLTATFASVPDGASEFIRQLAREHQQLNERFGPNYAKVRELRAQIDRVRESARGARSRLEETEVRDLLNALQRSLQSMDEMQGELDQQYSQKRKEAKQFELDMLADDDLRNKLERQRLLFNTVVEQLKQARFVSDYSSINVQVIEPPKALRGPVWPRIGLTLALAPLVGGMLGVSIVILSDRFDTRIRSLDELRHVTGLSVIGQVGLMTGKKHGSQHHFGFISHSSPRSEWAEAYRVARTNIDFLRRDQPLQVLLVTSAYAEEGKTVTSSNLAISYAAAGRRVLLIDANLRRPFLDKIHGLDRTLGLSSVLQHGMPLDRVVQHSQVHNLDVITAGPEVTDPAELLLSPRMGWILEEARQSYDLIFLDSAPLLAVADPEIIGGEVDGIVLTVRAWMLDPRDAQQAMDVLRGMKTHVLGLIINGIRPEPGCVGSALAPV